MAQTSSVLINRLLASGRFRHVQVLLKLAELGSVQRTAEAIGMAQPTVTQTLASLEALLEMPLFERHARGVRPTPACLDVLPAARQMFLGIAGTAEAVLARRSRDAAVVRMLGSAAAINGLLLHALPEFLRASPRVQVQLREAEADDLLLATTRGEVDLVACRRPAVVPVGWSFESLLEDGLVVICDAGHRLARRRRIDWHDVQQERWLLSPAGSVARQVFDDLSGHFERGPRTYPLVTRLLTITLKLLREESLLALLPDSFVRHQVDAGQMASLPLQGIPAMEPIGLLTPQTGLREGAEALVAFLRQHANAPL